MLRFSLTQLQKYQLKTFTILWMSYAVTYFLRKPIGVIKTDLHKDVGMNMAQLGWLDLALLMPYSLVQVMLGSVGDRLGPKKTLSFSLIICGLSMITFGAIASFPVFFVLLFLNGCAQGLCWPACCKYLNMWYPEQSRNSVFGIFATSGYGGGIIGTALAVYVQTTYGWRLVHLLPSLMALFIGLTVYVFIGTPGEVGITVPGSESKDQPDSQKLTKFWDIWNIPMIPELSFAMLSLKIVRYCMYMWLPIYLLHSLNYTKTDAGMFSTMFDIGGVFGSAAIGFIVDHFFKGRSLLTVWIFMVYSTGALIGFYVTSSWGLIANCVFMLFAGGFNCGPDALIGGSIASEVGEMAGVNSAAALTGFVNGFGTLGTIIEGPIVGLISYQFGWNGMFYFIIILSTIGSMSVLKAYTLHNYIRRKEREALINMEST